MGSLVTAIIQPEYTGENRCWPCTVANSAILLVCCFALALLSLPLAVVSLLAGAGAIRFRGYLVPYTPELVSRVRTILGREQPPLGTASLAPGEHGEKLGERTATTLIEGGVLVPEGGRLQLDEAFRVDWREEMARLRALSGEELIEAIEVATGETAVELLDADRPLIALTGPEGGEAWVSRPIAVAEAAAVTALAARIPQLSNAHRLAAARALRAFLRRCPVCGTRTEETSPHRCCGGVRSRRARSGSVLVCPACNEALYRFPAE